MADSNPLREFVSNLPRLDPGRLRPSKRTTTKRPFTFSPDWDVSRNSPNTTSDPDSTDTEGNLTPQSRRVSLPASVSIHKSELEASESLPTPETRRVSLPAHVSLNQSKLVSSLPERVRSLSGRKPSPQSHRIDSPASSVASGRSGLSTPNSAKKGSAHKSSPQSSRTKSPAVIVPDQSELSTTKSLRNRSVREPTPQLKRTESPVSIVSYQAELPTPKSLRYRSVREPTPQSKRNESPVPVVSDQSELPTPKRLRNRSVREPTPPSKRTESPVPVVSDQSELPTPKSLRNRSVRKPTPQSKRTESPVPVVSDQSELLTTKRLRNRSVHEPTPQSKRTESPVSVSLAQSGLSPVKDQGKSTYEAIDQSAGTETESITKTDDQLTDVLLVSNPEQQSSDQQSPTKSVHFKQDLQRLPQPVIANASDAPSQQTQPTNRHSALKANKVASLQTPGKRTSPRGQSPELETQHGSFLYTTLPFESGPVVRRKRRRSKTPPAVQDNTLPIETGEVRMWSGNRCHRTAADIIDLDVILEMVEEISFEYKNSVESSVVKRAMNEFFRTFRKSAIDLIDQTQEYKVLRSAVSRNTSSIVKLRKRIFDLQKEEINLDTELINKKKKLEKMEMDKKDWLEISEFQFDLQDILQEFAGMEAHTKQADYKSSANIPAMMTDVTNTMTAVSNLRSINDDLQHWLDQH